MEKKLMTKVQIYDLVYNYPSRHKEGLMPDEIKDILNAITESGHTIHQEKYDLSMMGNTCLMKDGELCIYNCDVYTAVICGIENRNETIWEMD